MVKAMSVPDRYDAYWIPGVESDLDPDTAMRLGLRWLDRSPYAGPGVIVVNAKGAWASDHLVASSGYQVVSPQSGRVQGGPAGAVLALFPTLKTLGLAQRLALDSGLCVIPGSYEDVKPWIVRTGATNLDDPDVAAPELADLADDAKETVDHIVFFVGHKSIGGDEKVFTVRQLQALARDEHPPEPDALVAYAMTKGKLTAKALAQLRDVYEGLLAGKRFNDSSGRAIQ